MDKSITRKHGEELYRTGWKSGSDTHRTSFFELGKSEIPRPGIQPNFRLVLMVETLSLASLPLGRVRRG